MKDNAKKGASKGPANKRKFTGGGLFTLPNQKLAKKQAIAAFIERNVKGYPQLESMKTRGENLLKLYTDFKPQTYESLGILEYLNSNIRIEGKTIPAKYDFGLIEVNNSDQEARLVDFKVPELDLMKTPLSALEVVKNGSITAAKFQEVIDFVASEKLASETFKIPLSEDVSEVQQKLLRRVLQARCGEKCIVLREKDNEEDVIVVRKFEPVKDKRDLADDWLWPKPYVHFVLLKANKTTPKLIEWVAKELNVPMSSFAYARSNNNYTIGMLQFLSAKYVEPMRLKKLFEARNDIGNFEFHDSPIDADCKGFIHQIVIRDVKTDVAVVNEALETFKETGYINYFPATHLDLFKLPLHHVAVALLKGNLRRASKLILQPNNAGLPAIADKCHKIKENYFIFRDAKKALAMYKDKTKEGVNEPLERHLLKCIQEDKNLNETFEGVPKGQLRGYLEAYQHYVWNHVVSRFVKERGMKICVGDLVFADEVEENGAVGGVKAVKVVTEEDLKANRYTYKDIVLPTLGPNIQYPENNVAQLYDDVLKEESLEKDKQSTTFELVGTYRPVFAMPQRLKWWIKSYKHETEPIVMRRVSENATDDEGSNKALIMEFYLARDGQSRVLLREIFKTNDCGKLATLDKKMAKQHENDLKMLVETASGMMMERKMAAQMQRQLDLGPPPPRPFGRPGGPWPGPFDEPMGGGFNSAGGYSGGGWIGPHPFNDYGPQAQFRGGFGGGGGGGFNDDFGMRGGQSRRMMDDDFHNSFGPPQKRPCFGGNDDFAMIQRRSDFGNQRGGDFFGNRWSGAVGGPMGGPPGGGRMNDFPASRPGFDNSFNRPFSYGNSYLGGRPNFGNRGDFGGDMNRQQRGFGANKGGKKFF